MTEAAVKLLKLDGSAGLLFAVCYEPPQPGDIGVVVCPPFAEEMNKCRRMTSLAARNLAARSHRVLVTDLHGTGDSAGEFHEATWEQWLADLDTATDWLLRSGSAAVVYWGTRLGCLLALDAAQRRRATTRGLVFWQPVVAGKTFMTQFLRLKMASQLTGSAKAVGPAELRALAARGESLEVAGYRLAPDLLRGVDAADLRALQSPGGPPVAWMEVAPESRREPLPVSQKVIEAWRAAGTDVRTSVVNGPQFWSTPETTIVPELTDSTAVEIDRFT